MNIFQNLLQNNSEIDQFDSKPNFGPKISRRKNMSDWEDCFAELGKRSCWNKSGKEKVVNNVKSKATNRSRQGGTRRQRMSSEKQKIRN